eukprot:TRINITY_DN37279_c0_g1_i1.p1 TRINITY_DN37279_c0_g1~~TRINITY_DN37279_c0_g1_i1.p1  ORF type:complete len:550 (-),score=99.96 TRINITY_DN37279_c0_g1_i1:605-2254(-)
MKRIMRTRKFLIQLSLLICALGQSDYDECFISNSGCTCRQDWSYKGMNGISGCANLDNDPLGPWCLVEDSTQCSEGAPLSILPGEDSTPFDYCKKDCNTNSNGDANYLESTPTTASQSSNDYSINTNIYDNNNEQNNVCYTTYAGCKCQEDWSYKGVSGLSGCANPDGDSVGRWCIIDQSQQCEFGEPLSTLPAADNAPFDYCNKECKTVVDDSFQSDNFLDNFYAQNATLLMQKGFASALSSVFVGTVSSSSGLLPWNSGDFFFDFDDIFGSTSPSYSVASSLSQAFATPNDIIVTAQTYSTGDNSIAQALSQAQVQGNYAYVQAVSTPTQVGSAALVIQNPDAAQPVPNVVAIAEAVSYAPMPVSTMRINIPSPSPSPIFPIMVAEPVTQSESVMDMAADTGPDSLTARQREYVGAHNLRRDTHCVPFLEWDDTLATQSQNYANLCIFEHSDAEGVGENLFLGKGLVFSPEFVVEAWYEEIDFYNFNNPGFSSATGHFTQVVWESTSKVGCGEVTNCPDGSHIVVCQYRPPGNFVGRFAENVPPPCK